MVKRYLSPVRAHLDLQLYKLLDAIYKIPAQDARPDRPRFFLARYQRTFEERELLVDYVRGIVLQKQLTMDPPAHKSERLRGAYLARVSDLIERIKQAGLAAGVKEITPEQSDYKHYFMAPNPDGTSVFLIHARDPITYKLTEPFIIKSDNIIAQGESEDMWIIDPG